MNNPLKDNDGNDLTRRTQTFFLSAEFLITMLIQTGVLLVVGTSVVNGIDSRVAALESQQVTAERIARIEEKMAMLLANQIEFKSVVREVQVELKSQRRD